MKLLALDSAGACASAALWIDGQCLERRFEGLGASQGEQLLPLIEALLGEAGIGLSALDVIAVGRGPGAFTGVRLAIGVAQGLAYSLQRPVIPISNLRASASLAFERHAFAAAALICHDARMGEVYWGCFLRAGCAPIGSERLGAPAAVTLPGGSAPASAWIGAGSGFGAYPPLGERLRAQLGGSDSALSGGAGRIATLAAADGLAAAVAAEALQPVYLRDDVARPAPAADAARGCER